MRIAVLSHYFWPELGAPTARLLEMGREWVAQGHTPPRATVEAKLANPACLIELVVVAAQR